MKTKISDFGILRNHLYALSTMEKSIHSRHQRKLQELLRQVRREANLRQVDLAQKLGEPQSFVSKYENGERRLDILEIREVCMAIGIPLEEFARRLEGRLHEES